MIKLKDLLKETIDLSISKIEEQHALQFIRTQVILDVVRLWNNNSPSHWKIEPSDILKNLKKSFQRLSADGNTVEHVTYSAAVPMPYGQPHKFSFWVHKDHNDGGLMVTSDPHLQKFGTRQWYLS